MKGATKGSKHGTMEHFNSLTIAKFFCDKIGIS